MSDNFRDWAALHAPFVPMGWREEGRPVQSQPFTEETRRAYDAATAEFEANREVEWRWHFADMMVAKRKAGPQ